jgi:hypothetical protein
LGPVQPRQLEALDRAATIQLSQPGPKPVAARLITPVGHYQQNPVLAQVADQKRKQITGGLIRPVDVLHHHGDRRLPAEADEQAEQQFEQPRLRSLASWSGLGLTQAGQQPGQLTPGRACQLAHRLPTELVR